MRCCFCHKRLKFGEIYYRKVLNEHGMILAYQPACQKCADERSQEVKYDVPRSVDKPER